MKINIEILLRSREHSPFGGHSQPYPQILWNHVPIINHILPSCNIFVNAYIFDSAIIIYANETWYIYFILRHISSIISSIFEIKFSSRLCTAHNYTVIAIHTLTACFIGPNAWFSYRKIILLTISDRTLCLSSLIASSSLIA